MKGELFAVITMLVIGVFVVLMALFPEYSTMYKKGVKDTHREAFENGLMEKEISKDDKVIYRWIETHKMEIE
jgi:hypothetical protein